MKPYYKYEIPEGYEARIEENNVIIQPKQSEDERIRNDIVTFIKFALEDGSVISPGSHTTKEEALAYIERQKTKEKYNRMTPIYNDQESFEEALDKAWKFYNDSGASAVDGYEDNRIELAFAKGFREGFLAGKQKEQSVEWSEEDEQWLESIIKDYEDSLVKDKDHAAIIEIKIDFLKSFRKQPHWKPSKEQMDALEASYSVLKTHDTWGEDEHLPILMLLINDLQKLL